MKTRKMRNTSNSKGSGSKIENRRHFSRPTRPPPRELAGGLAINCKETHMSLQKEANLHSELGSFDLRFLPRHAEFQTVD